MSPMLYFWEMSRFEPRELSCWIPFGTVLKKVMNHGCVNIFWCRQKKLEWSVVRCPDTGCRKFWFQCSGTVKGTGTVPAKSYGSYGSATLLGSHADGQTVTYPEMEFLDISLTKDSSLFSSVLLPAMHNAQFLLLADLKKTILYTCLKILKYWV